jgi:outer membrane immunogenic protein
VLSPLDAAIVNAAHDWAGAYAGVNAGYSVGDFDVSVPAPLSGDPSFSGDGLLGGFQIGYNKQLGSMVIGVEGDIQASGADGSTSYPGGGNSTTATLDWFSTARGRIGYAFDSTMVYGTAGLAIGGLEVSSDGESDDNTLIGVAAGAGVEQALTDSLSLKAEYLYVDTEKKSFTAGGQNTQAEWDGHVMRFGANLKF